jgi:hypothetical protein
MLELLRIAWREAPGAVASASAAMGFMAVVGFAVGTFLERARWQRFRAQTLQQLSPFQLSQLRHLAAKAAARRLRR